MIKSSPPSLTVVGFCQGCRRHHLRLTLVTPNRYRCDECATREKR
jgi:hypothetical protein